MVNFTISLFLFISECLYLAEDYDICIASARFIYFMKKTPDQNLIF